eukprot:TRINITY_DN7792_c0_g4_i2.p1 TRINITY_DN7792_c0_g4~~TRINITY_DN7792_c0_g4_i2.p1  ORF type:complete len:314 (-),score=35.82 TRINITY_DN7792_c0_g4_i2:67-1008(-)
MMEYQKATRGIKRFTHCHASTVVAKQFFSDVKEGEVLVLNGYDEKRVVFRDDFARNRTALQEFLEIHSYPVVIRNMGSEVSIALDRGERKAIFMYRNEKTHDAEFEKLAHDLRSKDYLFYLVDFSDAFHQEIAAFIGIYESDLPVLQYATNEGERKVYRYKGEFTFPAMKAFIEECRKGNYKRFYPSQPVPSSNSGPVYRVVGSTFQSEVIDSDKDVILKFYDDYCPYCETLKPVYEEVAKSFNGKVKFCEINGNVNDVEGHLIDKFPTVLVFLKGQKETPTEYEGELAVEPLLAFIEVQTGIHAEDGKKNEL